MRSGLSKMSGASRERCFRSWPGGWNVVFYPTTRLLRRNIRSVCVRAAYGYSRISSYMFRSNGVLQKVGTKEISLQSN